MIDSAKAGAQFLDTMFPGWCDYISIEKLNLSDAETCILGQLYGEYSNGLYELELEMWDAEELGFDLPSSNFEYDKGNDIPSGYYNLTQSWIREIEDRC